MVEVITLMAAKRQSERVSIRSRQPLSDSDVTIRSSVSSAVTMKEQHCYVVGAQCEAAISMTKSQERAEGREKERERERETSRMPVRMDEEGGG
jgi:hypothetical protein